MKRTNNTKSESGCIDIVQPDADKVDGNLGVQPVVRRIDIRINSREYPADKDTLELWTDELRSLAESLSTEPETKSEVVED